MIDKTYAKAYTEVLEIIRHFPEEEYAKIPIEKIEFYKNNMDKEYDFTIDPESDLSKQNISPNANAIIVNLFKDYFATEEQKIKIEEILKINQEKEEQEKREKYNPENLFKNKNMSKVENAQQEKALIEYKEPFFKRIINKIKNFFNLI